MTPTPQIYKSFAPPAKTPPLALLADARGARSLSLPSLRVCSFFFGFGRLFFFVIENGMYHMFFVWFFLFGWMFCDLCFDYMSSIFTIRWNPLMANGEVFLSIVCRVCSAGCAALGMDGWLVGWLNSTEVVRENLSPKTRIKNPHMSMSFTSYDTRMWPSGSGQ